MIILFHNIKWFIGMCFDHGRVLMYSVLLGCMTDETTPWRRTQNFLKLTSAIAVSSVRTFFRSSWEAGSDMSGVASTLAKKRARAAGFGTNANANKYLNQDYEALRSQHQGQLFCDPYFPAAPESLGFQELGPNSSKTRGVQWKRPGVSGAE